MARSWRSADESALDWIKEASPASSVTGFDVQGLPDSILVLHRMYERVDGQPIPHEGGFPDGSAGPEWIGPITGDFRLLTWREYAQRRGVQTLRVDTWPFAHDEDGVTSEPALYPPSEGGIEDVATWTAIMAILTAHSSAGPDTWCTAYYFDFLAYDPRRGQAPHIFRGRLGDSDDLIAPPQVNYSSPQNLWPDDRQWVLHTDYDDWYTKISGPSDLIQALAESPELETVHATL